MTQRNVIHSPTTSEHLDHAIERAEPHLRPVLEVVRDGAIGMLFVGQSADPFRIPADPKRPALVIIGDDFDRAVGPDGFHSASVRRAIRSCRSFAVVASAPVPVVYATIATTAAVSRQNTMLIETRPEQEIQWVSLIQKLAPRRFVWLSTVEGGRA